MDQKTKEFTEHFQKWIDNYAEDTRLLMALARDEKMPEDVRRLAVGTLNYNLKQLDLIPDFYTPVGLIDDAMIIRVFAHLVADAFPKIAENRTRARLEELARENAVLEEFCGDAIYKALSKYVKTLPDRKVRQRDAKIILDNPSVMKEFMDDLEAEIRGYEGAAIDDPENVLKELKSFLKLKLIG